jgi:hypothetical protein
LIQCLSFCGTLTILDLDIGQLYNEGLVLLLPNDMKCISGLLNALVNLQKLILNMNKFVLDDKLAESDEVAEMMSSLCKVGNGSLYDLTLNLTNLL